MTALTLAARAVACAGATALSLAALSFGHGGTYRGPGDTVPPGGGGGSGGHGPATGPGGSGPGGGDPTTPGYGPPTPGGGPGQPGAGAPQTSGPDDDLTAWSFWWEFNKEPYLDIKAAIHDAGTYTGSDSYFLGNPANAKDRLRPTEEQVREQVVPALLKALATETNNDILTGCMIALAKIGDEKSESGESRLEEAIKPHLKDGNQEIAETAAVALGILANDSSVDTLVALLRDSAQGRALVGAGEVKLRTRAFAAYGLSLIGARTPHESTRSAIISHIVGVLESDTSSTRDVKVACVIALGLVPLEQARPAVAPEAGKTPAPETCREGQLEYLLSYFADAKEHHYLVRAHVPAALGRLLNGLPPEDYAAYKQRIAELLLAGFDKRSKEPVEVVQSCVLALGQIGDNDADALDQSIRTALIAASDEASGQQARNFSLIALAQVGGRIGAGAAPKQDEVSKHLVATMEHGTNALQPWAGLAIGVYGRALLDQDLPAPSQAMAALRAKLAQAKTDLAIPPYAIGAGLLKDAEAVDDLLEKLGKDRDTTRGYVAVALGLIGVQKAVEPVSFVVKESKHRPELLKQAAIGLGLLGDKQAVPDLIEMLADTDTISTQAALASALGSIGDSRSIDPLVAMLENHELSAGARGFAAVALGIVADKEARPWNSKISVGLNYRASTETLTDQTNSGILNIL
jgi:HEAT repeat protein